MDNYLDYEPPLPYIGQEEAAPARIGRINNDLSPRSKYFPDWHLSQLTIAERAEIREKIAVLNAEIYIINQEREERNNRHSTLKKSYSTQLAECSNAFPLVATAICTQCKFNQLNTYKISDGSYFCQCKKCGICGHGLTNKTALEDVYDAIWSQNI